MTGAGAPPPLAFTLHDWTAAYEAVGANCGPGALAAVSGSTPAAIVDILGEEFRRRRATTELMLEAALDRLGIGWSACDPACTPFPAFGLARVQWHGPWMDTPDRYAPLRHSHWVASCRLDCPGGCTPDEAVQDGGALHIFDINAMSVGGWIPFDEWRTRLVPWLLERCEPGATGGWHVVDSYALDRISPHAA